MAFKACNSVTAGLDTGFMAQNLESHYVSICETGSFCLFLLEKLQLINHFFM